MSKSRLIYFVVPLFGNNKNGQFLLYFYYAGMDIYFKDRPMVDTIRNEFPKLVSNH